MKYFLKVVRHYADFSGRARPKEYWMFVLFNVIFLIVWTFVAALAFTLTANTGSDESVVRIIAASYFIALMLPSLAVAVRRLHDTGRSGWMLLIGLIPIIGGIWLLVLMVQDGEPEENCYGRNPITSPPIYSEPARLTSAGITLIVAAGIAFLTTIATVITILSSSSHWLNVPLTVINFAVNVMMLIAGILLLSERLIYNMRQKGKNAFILILLAAFLPFAISIYNFIRYGAGYLMAVFGIAVPPVIGFGIHCLTLLSLALFAISVIYLRKNQNRVHNAAIAVIVFSCINLLLSVYVSMYLFARNTDEKNAILSLIGIWNILFPIAYIVLAGTFLSKETQNIIDSSMPVSTLDKKGDSFQPVPSSTFQPQQVTVESQIISKPPIKKPTLLWVIIGFAITVILFLTSLDQMEKLWYLFVMFIGWDITALIRYFGRKQAYKKMLKDAEGLTGEGIPVENRTLAAPATIRVVRESSILGAIVPYKVFVNNQFAGKIKNGKILEISTSVSHNIVMVLDMNDNAFKGDFTVDLKEGGYAEVHVKAGRFVKR